VRHLLKNLDDKLERKTIQKSILIFKDLKYRINQNIFCIFQRHKNIPRLTTIISMNVMSVTVGRLSQSG